MIATRSYKLKIINPNKAKLSTALYAYNRHLMYVNWFCGRLFFNGNKHVSTNGMGRLANNAKYRARGIIKRQKESCKVTGNKANVPIIKTIGCPAIVESSNNIFDYWISIVNQWGGSRVKLPVNSNKIFNKALKNGWELTTSCEFYIDKQGRCFALVYVKKEVNRAMLKEKSIGFDVGYKYSVCRSDGYLGKRIDKIIKKNRLKNAERNRQKHYKKSKKTIIKQILDIEAKKAIVRCKSINANLILESPKRLANLKSGRLQGWARSYFANRCTILTKESEIFIWDVNPYNTSITCNRCGHIDRQSRNGFRFVCTQCGKKTHADVNAAKNLVLNGTQSLIKKGVKEG